MKICFYVEQGGKMFHLKDFDDTPTHFIDISSQIISGGEKGLLGMEIHPNLP